MPNITQITVLDGSTSPAHTPMASWNGHVFDVSSSVVRGFSDMKIKAGSETKNKTASKQKYVARKAGSVREITMSIILHAYLGIPDVYSEAVDFLADANNGESDYFYLGDAKLFSAKMMLTSAEVIEIVHYPGQGNKWISCKINVTFKQGSKNKKKSKSKKKSGGSGGKKKGGKKNGSKSWLRRTGDSIKDAKKKLEEVNQTNKNASRVSGAGKGKYKVGSTGSTKKGHFG